MQFEDLFLDDRLLSTVADLGYETPTEIQQEAIPLILADEDVLACAATGTGKTAAYVLPLMQKMLDDESPYRGKAAKALILAPTRELAFQIQHSIQQLGKVVNPRIMMATGGQSPAAQIDFLRQGGDMIIATPGRLLNLTEEHNADLSAIEYVVIDEADRMLDMGQGPDVANLLSNIETEFQTCLFSATLAGPGVEIFTEELLPHAQRITIHAANTHAEQVKQMVYLADNKDHKLALLAALVQFKECKSALVFCNKKERAEEIAQYLQSRNLSAQVVHGDFTQAERRNRTRKFRQGQTKVLVATDVAARGLDLPQVSHVVNYDVPHRGDIYIHRVGRTGRAGQTGTAVNLVEPNDQKNLERIEFHLKKKLPLMKMQGLAPKAKSNKSKLKKKDKPRYIAKKDRENPEQN